jgi:hypothetical protein
MQNKRLFFLTDTHIDWCEWVMQKTLGAHWKAFFDLVCYNTKKPLFFSSTNCFFWHACITSTIELQKAYQMSQHRVFLGGNAKLLTQFFQAEVDKEDVKIAYFGSHGNNDIQACHSFNEKMKSEGAKSNWDVIAVINEMADPKKMFPDQDRFKPFPEQKDGLWGPSYFHDYHERVYDDIETILDSPQPKNFFITEIERCCRYAVPTVRNINMMVPSKTYKFRKLPPHLLRRLGGLKKDKPD